MARYVVLLGLCAVIPDSLQGGMIYWSDLSNPPNGAIRFEDTDNPGISTLVSPLFEPRGLQFDGSHFYWSVVGNAVGSIQSANADGSGVTTLVAGLASPLNLTADFANGHLYWADRTAGKIQRSNLDGTALTDLVSGLSFPHGLAVDLVNGHLYFDDTALTVKRADLDGSNLTTIIDNAGMHTFRDFEVDPVSGTLYFSTFNSIFKSDLNGSGITPLISSVSTNLQAIRLDTSLGFLYWSDAANGRISRANLDGTNAVSLVTGAGIPDGFVVLGSAVPEPTSVVLFGAGLMSIRLFRKRLGRRVHSWGTR